LLTLRPPLDRDTLRDPEEDRDLETLPLDRDDFEDRETLREDLDGELVLDREDTPLDEREVLVAERVV
jgi:hypothetical protein